eukprot:m.194692 g.194692  ORF g.194692 m.194692 type:complete len:116 (+) comp15678_c0_seq9:1141-1488(+)
MTFLQLLSDMEEKMIWMLKFMGGLCLEIDEAERKASYIKGIENERKVVVETLEANHGEYTRMNAVVVLTIPLKSLLAATVTKIWICILCKPSNQHNLSLFFLERNSMTTKTSKFN